MTDYRIRPATLADIDVLVHHRIAMFTDMGTAMDADGIASAFRNWLARMMPAGTYRGWLVETASREVVAGGGITLLPWPPGPRDLAGDRIAFVYNVYTEPAHRRRGLARLVMETVHAWCRVEGIPAVALNASDDGRSLYDAMGYQATPAPMMWCLIE
jgi:GNAT superfamily N-acetyltransferase